MPRIIYRGGYDKLDKESIKNSIVFAYSDIVKTFLRKGKKVAFVTLAKPDRYYNEMILPLVGNKADIIENSTSKNVPWTKYDLIFLLGGDQTELKNGLTRKNFDFNILDDNQIIIGDSAGAFVITSYFYVHKGKKLGDRIIFEKGFYPDSNVIVLAHCNNERYVNEKLDNKVVAFAKKKNLRVLRLNENEEKLLDKSGNFVDFKREMIAETSKLV